MLVGYPQEPDTLGRWDATCSASNQINGTSGVSGGVLPEGTASVLFIGRQGLGEWCYGSGPECGDPAYHDQGNHVYL